MWLLPWEKWLPAWVLGPAMFIGSIAALALDSKLHWWDYVLLPLATLGGVWVTFAWFKDGRHVLREDARTTEPSKKDQSKD